MCCGCAAKTCKPRHECHLEYHWHLGAGRYHAWRVGLFVVESRQTMTDLETAILDILRRFRPGAMTISDIQTQLLGQGWTVYAIPPHSITEALITLEDAKKIVNELAWNALADPEAQA